MLYYLLRKKLKSSHNILLFLALLSPDLYALNLDFTDFENILGLELESELEDNTNLDTLNIYEDPEIIKAKEYFYQFGEINNKCISDLDIEERQKQFVDLPIEYGFSIEELITHNKLPKEDYKDINGKREAILNLSYLKINSLKGFSKIPHARRITAISLDNNQIDDLNDLDLSKFKRLKKITITNNKIYLIPLGIFEKAILLEEINLNSNHIRAIHDFAFNNLINLQYIYLMDNQLNQQAANQHQNQQFQTDGIFFSAFSVLPNLKYIFLHNNNYNSITELRYLAGIIKDKIVF